MIGIDRSYPPKQPIQWLLDKRGRKFYKGADGIWKAPDNSNAAGRYAIRDIHISKYIKFNGNEAVSIPNPITLPVYQDGFEIETMARPFDQTNKGRIFDSRDANKVLDNYFALWFEYDSVEGAYMLVYVFRDDAGRINSSFYKLQSSGFAKYKIFVNPNYSDINDIKIYENGAELPIYRIDKEDFLGVWTKEAEPMACIGALIDGGGFLYYGYHDQAYIKFTSNGKLISQYSFEEGAGLKSYDASGNGLHGDVSLGGTLEEDFYQSSQAGEVPSFLNSNGYNYMDGVFIPASIAIPGQDVLGNTLADTHKGRVRYEADVIGGSIAYFDGRIYAVIPFASTPISDSFSVYVRCRTSSDDRGIITAGRSRGGTDDRDWGLFQNGSEVKFTVNIEEVFTSIGTLELLTQGEWYEVLVVYEENVAMSIYINGELKASTQVSGSRVKRQNVNIGGFDLWSYIGNIAHFKMWDYAISVDEIGSDSRWNYVFSETSGLIMYNTGKNRPAGSDASVKLNGSANGTQWDVDNDQIPFNLLNGFTDKSGVKVPADPDRSGVDVEGNPLSNISAGAVYNGAESTIYLNPHNAPELIQAGIDQTTTLP